MGQIVKTTTRWECDGCDLVEEFEGDLDHAEADRWRKLKTVVPEARDGAYEVETGQDWLLCRPCYRLATQRMGNLKAEHAELVELRRIVHSVRTGADLHPWIWQDDQHDDLASLAAGVVVQITAVQLAHLIEQAEERGEAGTT